MVGGDADADARVRASAPPPAVSRTTLQSGAQRLVGAAPDIFCFERQLDRRFLVALNFSSRRVPLPLASADSPAVLELSTDPGRDHGALDPRDLVLEPDEGVILRLSQA